MSITVNDGQPINRWNYMSAYAIAVKHGFRGTESEWLALVYGGSERAHADAERAETARIKAEDAQGKAESAQDKAAYAQGKAEAAKTGAEYAASNSEAYAAGTRNGAAVSNSDPAYANNAKHYSEQAESSAAAAEISKNTAQLAAGAFYKIASTAAGMTDTDAVYVYVGSEVGYTNGAWYYHNGASWVLGGTSVDPSLSVSGAAADAEKTGELRVHMDESLAPSKNLFTLAGAVLGRIDVSGDVVEWSQYPDKRTTDFIPAAAAKTYSFNTMTDEPFAYYPQIVGFYNSAKAFISRVTLYDNTYLITTPANTAYLRVTEGSDRNFPADLTLASDGAISPVAHRVLREDAAANARLVELAKVTGNYGSVLDLEDIPFIIQGEAYSYAWGASVYSGAPDYAIVYSGTHVLIPVKEGDRVELTARKSTGVRSVYAMLKDSKCYLGQTPSFVYQYDIVETDEGMTFEVKTDAGGNPITDTRHLVAAGAKEGFIVVPETHYLYLTHRIKSDNVEYDTLPLITINGVTINRDMEDEEKEDIVQYSEVFFDDFDNFDESVWERVTTPPPVSGEYGPYNSRFYTDARNAYAEQSCLVMRCAKREPGDVNPGTHDSGGTLVPNEYLAAYVSSGKALAVKNGRISARMKISGPMGKDFFPWAFWTFGQNAIWSYAPEIDVIEGIQYILTEPRVVGGMTYNAGSILSTVSGHVHATNSGGTDVNTIRYASIAYANKVGDVVQDDDVVYRVGRFDASEWHVYTTEFDEQQIRIYIDGELFRAFNAAEIGAVGPDGSTGFFSAQDIRFNIKASAASTAEDGYLFVDWVRVETVDPAPCTSISHDNITLSVGETVCIDPSFNDGCANRAFSMTTESDKIAINDYVVSGEVVKMTGNIVHSITGLRAGTAAVTLRSANGRTTGAFTVTIV